MQDFTSRSPRHETKHEIGLSSQCIVSGTISWVIFLDFVGPLVSPNLYSPARGRLSRGGGALDAAAHGWRGPWGWRSALLQRQRLRLWACDGGACDCDCVWLSLHWRSLRRGVAEPLCPRLDGLAAVEPCARGQTDSRWTASRPLRMASWWRSAWWMGRASRRSTADLATVAGGVAMKQRKCLSVGFKVFSKFWKQCGYILLPWNQSHFCPPSFMQNTDVSLY